MASKAAELAALVNATLKKDVMGMASDEKYSTTYTPTSILPFDVIFNGGIPRGRFIQISGDFSTLKSFIGLTAIAEHQKRGMVCAVIDTEHSFDKDWAKSCGVDTTDLIIRQPDSGEQAMDICEVLIRGGCNLIVFDSIAAMTPQAEQEKRLEGENIQPARIAMLMSAAMRRLTTANTNTSMIFINQTRTNIGITFGSAEALPGGKALPFYSSMSVSIRKVGKVTRDRKVFDGEKWVNTKLQIGQKFKMELTKSKLSKPFAEEWFTWDMTTGSIDMVGYLIAQGLEYNAIEIKGATWYVGSRKVAVGKDKFRKVVESDDDLKLQLENVVREARGIETIAVPTVRRQTTSKARPAQRAKTRLSVSRGRSNPEVNRGSTPKRKLPRS